MWPWGHAAVGYLIYVGWFRLRWNSWPPRSGIIAAIFATQIPDLIDKPLAWTFHVLPSGRSIGHSLILAVPLLTALMIFSTQVDRPDLSPAIGIGYLSGILTDLPLAVLRGHFHDATFLFWPLLPSPEYDIEPSFAAHFARLDVPSLFGIEFFLATLAIFLFLYNIANH